MKFKKIGIVISKEYFSRVRKKSFLVTTFVVPVLFAALCCIPVLIMLFNRDEGKCIAVVDESSLVAPALESSSSVQFADCSSCKLDSLKSNFDSLSYSAILYVSPLDSNNSVSLSTFSKKPVGAGIIENVQAVAKTAVRNYRLEQYGIDGLSDIVAAAEPEMTVRTYTIVDDGEDQLSNNKVYMYLSLTLGMVIFIFITMFASAVMSSVVEEKQSKIVEVLLSSLNAVELMFGKIIGVALVALTQFLLWIVLTVLIVSAVFAFAGGGALEQVGTAGTTLVQEQGVMIGGLDTVGGMGDNMAQTGKTAEILQTLAGMDLPQILFFFLLFFVLGYLLYASMFAAIGSAVDNVDDGNQMQVPLTVPLMLGYFIAIYAWNAPDSALAVWGSVIPFTSPIVMLARIPFGVPSWQLWLSIIVLALTFVIMAWMSAKIYRVGVLTSGKRPNFKDLWKWIRQN